MMEGNTKNKAAGSGSTISCRCWTNERHIRFLNSIEASFVRAMFENNGHRSYDLRLDRHVPDSSESTQDLPKERRRRYSTSDVIVADAEPRMRADKKSKRLLSSNDQVVPQLEIRRDNKDDNDRPLES